MRPNWTYIDFRGDLAQQFGQGFQTGMQIGEAYNRGRERRRAEVEAKRLGEARRMAFQGASPEERSQGMDTLWAVAPQQAMAAEQYHAQMQERTDKETMAGLERILRAEQSGDASIYTSVARNEGSRLRSMSERGLIRSDVGDWEKYPPTPEEAQLMYGQLQQRYAQPQEAPKPQDSPEAIKAANLLGRRNVGEAMEDTEWRGMIRRVIFDAPLEQSKARGQTIQNIMPNVAPSTHTVGKIQDDMRVAYQKIASLQEIRDALTGPNGKMRTEQLVGLFPKLKQKGMRLVDVLGAVEELPEADREQYRAVQNLRAVTMGFRAEEYHNLLGSAQTLQEMQNLADTIPDMDMGSLQFEAAVNSLERRARMSLAISEQLLRSPEKGGGFNLEAGSSAFASAVDARFKDAMHAEIRRKAAEMKAAGVSKVDAVKELYRQGLYTADEYRSMLSGM